MVIGMIAAELQNREAMGNKGLMLMLWKLMLMLWQ
jgi:hypothetical protein